MTKVFLSYARGDDELFVKRLYEDLTKVGFTVWFDRNSLLSRGLTFHQEIKDAIRTEVDRVVYIGGPKAANSKYVREEWKSALEYDHVVVTPILRLGDYEQIPGELSLLHCEDFRKDATYDKALARLIESLNQPNPRLGGLFAVPSLPPYFLVRPDLMRHVRDALLVDLQKPQVITSADTKVGMQGMGGIGKSVLAAALVRNREIRQSYPDGIVWLAFGQHLSGVDLLNRQYDLAKALGGNAEFSSLAQGMGVLRDLLATKSVMLVLDDVWKAADAKAFDVLGLRCRMLVTTRDAGILHSLNGELVPVSLFSEQEALHLLADAVNINPTDLSQEAREVARECGYLPLALALSGGMAKKRGRDFHSVLERLRSADLDKIADRESINEQHRSIWRAMQASVEMLSETEQKRYAELAVFENGEMVPEAAVATLWEHTGNLDDLDTEDLLINLYERSLIQLDQKADEDGKIHRCFSLHDLLHDYAVRIAGEPRTLHQTMLDAYHKQCPDGWHTGPNDGYFFQSLRHHLIGSYKNDELANLLLDLNWLEAKANNDMCFDLLLDFTQALLFVNSDYPQKTLLPLLEEAILRDIHFIKRHPTALFQCLWNSCWWYDCPEAAKHYDPPRIGWPPEGAPWNQQGIKLFKLLESWLNSKNYLSPNFLWLRSLRPPAISLGTAQRLVISCHKGAIRSVAFSPDGQRVVSVHTDKTVRIWDSNYSTELTCIQTYDQQINCIKFSTNGRYIAGGLQDGTVRLWDSESGTLLACLRGHVGSVNSIAFSSDGRRIASGSCNVAVRVWDTETYTKLPSLWGHVTSINYISFISDSSRIAAISKDGTLRIWDCDNQDVLSFFQAVKEDVTCIAFTHDGRRFACGFEDTSVRLFSTETSFELLSLRGHGCNIRCIAFSSDGKYLAVGSQDSIIRVYDSETGKDLVSLRGHEGEITSVAFSLDGQSIVSGSADLTVRVWSLGKKGESACLCGEESSGTSFFLSPDGSHIVTTNPVQMWDIDSGLLLYRLDEHIDTLVFSPTGQCMAGVCCENVHVWNSQTGAEIVCLRGHKGSIYTIAFSPNGRLIASISNDNSVRIWDSENGNEINRSENIVTRGNSIAFSPDGKRLAFEISDSIVKIWDTFTNTELTCSIIYKYYPLFLSVRNTKLAFSSDGRRIAYISDDDKVRVWDSMTGDELGCLDSDLPPTVKPPLRRVSGYLSYCSGS
jgi:WD40 repeat protein